jgi:hypothetical protein
VSKGKKRGAPEGEGTTTRSSKAAKTSDATTAAKSNPKGGRKKTKVLNSFLKHIFCSQSPKAGLPASAFKSRALPLHVHITHTPPTIEEKSESAPVDPGSIGSLTLVPASFATGSYGWKGSKRVTIELPDPNSSDEKEKVQVMITFVTSFRVVRLRPWLTPAAYSINATVVGSKAAGTEDGAEAAASVEKQEIADVDKQETADAEKQEEEEAA